MSQHKRKISATAQTPKPKRKKSAYCIESSGSELEEMDGPGALGGEHGADRERVGEPSGGWQQPSTPEGVHHKVSVNELHGAFEMVAQKLAELEETQNQWELLVKDMAGIAREMVAELRGIREVMQTLTGQMKSFDWGVKTLVRLGRIVA